MSATLNRGMAFLLGFSFAFLPSFGPFVAVLFFLSKRPAFRRFDLLWLGSALLLATSTAVHGGLRGFAFGFLQVAGAWLVYRAFFHLRRDLFVSTHSATVAGGLVAGLAVVVGAGWLRMSDLSFAYKTLTQAVVWDASPAFYGHTVFVLGCLIALLSRSRLRFFALGLSAFGILVAGSREAAIAWVGIALLLFFSERGSSKRKRLTEFGLIALVLVLTSGLGSFFGWGRFGFLLDLAPSDGVYNLIPGTEIENGDWWDASGVRVESSSVSLGGETLTRYEVTKLEAATWLRLQQVVPITSGATYTVSAWVNPEDTAQAGLQGWGQLLESKQTFALSSALVDGRLTAAVSGPGRLVSSGIAEVEGDWRRIFATFEYDGPQEVLYFYVGLAPDRRPLLRTSAQFAGFQLEPGDALTPYIPGPATRGLSLADARIPYWQAAWQGIGEKPWLGWGRGTFSAYYGSNWPNNRKLRDLPSHVHNLFLQVLFEGGLLGFLGLAALVFALSWGALKTLDFGFLAVIAAVLFINLFDVTLFYGAVLYPLVAVAGWRVAAKSAPVRGAGQTSGDSLGISLGLALCDFAFAYLATAAALALTRPTDLALLANPFSPITYALLLWPVLAWREGLYPGYGLTAPLELKKHVAAATYAGLILAAGTVLFAEDLPLGLGTLGVAVAISLVALPLGRASLKRLLLGSQVWGREVVILGAGQAGQAVVRTLLNHPLEGLKPVAFFDDDLTKSGLKVAGLNVLGDLAAAERYARANGVVHAVVAIPTMPSLQLSDFVHRLSRSFRHVQVVPELAGLPAEEVLASPLAGFLALEFRNGLYIRRNRFVKRMIDTIVGTLAVLLASPLFLLIALLIRWDSKGPIFHASLRIGQHGKMFNCLKFRTMYLDAEERLAEVLEDPLLHAEYAQYHKLEHDPRITPVGRILRKYSLDELPQLLNVLAGDMSLVGPRPYLSREMSDIGVYGDTIFEARPGLTGYWQVSGRNALTFHERLEMEAHYVRNWSIWWDIVLLTKTPTVVLKREGAH